MFWETRDQTDVSTCNSTNNLTACYSATRRTATVAPMIGLEILIKSYFVGAAPPHDDEGSGHISLSDAVWRAACRRGAPPSLCALCDVVLLCSQCRAL